MVVQTESEGVEAKQGFKYAPEVVRLIPKLGQYPTDEEILVQVRMREAEISAIGARMIVTDGRAGF